MPISPLIPPTTLSSLPAPIWSGVRGYPVLPYIPGQAITLSKAPLWSTKTVRAVSGRERRTAHWPYPLWQFELSYEVIRHRPTPPELAALWEFFNVAQGQCGAWLFVDPTDCQVDNDPITDNIGDPILDAAADGVLAASGGANVGVGDGVTTSFQLMRQLRSWCEPVSAVYGAAILDNGIPASGYTLGPGGTVSFAQPPASGHVLTWTGYFYYLCRFLKDDLTFEQIVRQLWSGKSVKFTSLRP